MLTCVTATLHPSLICYLVTIQPPLTPFILLLSNFPLRTGMVITSVERWQAKKRNQDTVCKNNKLTLHCQRQRIIFPTFSFLPLDFRHKHGPTSIFSPFYFFSSFARIHHSAFYCLTLSSRSRAL